MRAWFLAIALMILTVAPAWAGGWAVTSLDALPDELRADMTYPIGYTIRQHGVTPFPNGKTSIEVVTSEGVALTFEGQADREAGHYVAAVRFPAAGTYSWRVNQDWFGAQELGLVTVLPAAAAASSAPPEPVLARLALPLVAGGALVLCALKAISLGRRLGPVRAVH